MQLQFMALVSPMGWGVKQFFLFRRLGHFFCFVGDYLFKLLNFMLKQRSRKIFSRKTKKHHK